MDQYDAANCDEFPVLEKIDDIKLYYFYQEQIVTFYYNLTRKQSDDSKLVDFLDHLLCSLDKTIRANPHQNFFQCLNILYKMIGQTRDCYEGKGEHDISYMMICVWYKYYPSLAIFALHKFVQPFDDGSPCYGSWRDIKNFCDYVRRHFEEGENHHLIQICIELINSTLHEDLEKWSCVVNEYVAKIYNCKDKDERNNFIKPDARDHISSLVKWIPREDKTFGWLYEQLVIQWVEKYQPYLLNSHKNMVGYYRALDKCKMNYRKQISILNKELDTTEIKMCSQKWNYIVPTKIPQTCMMKNKEKLCFNKSNIKSINKFKIFFYNKFIDTGSLFDPERTRSNTIPNNVSLSFFVKDAIRLLHNYDEYQVQFLNNQWKQFTEIIGNFSLKDCIPVLEISFHNYNEPFYNAIGLACLISEKSTFGRRILAVDNQPVWINLSNCNNLFSMINEIFRATKSMHSTTPNIMNALQLIVESIKETNVSNNKIRNMSLVLLHYSHDFLHNSSLRFHDKVIKLFYENGLHSTRKTPFPCPEIIYWNLSQNNFFQLPCSIDSTNGIILSGLSGNLITHLHLMQIMKKKQMKYNPFSIVYNIVNQPKFNKLNTFFDDYFHNDLCLHV